MPIIRAARLVRVSSRQQAQDDRTSLSNQIRELTEVCDRNGWISTDEDLFVEVISGAKGKDKREILSQLLERVQDGWYQRLCVLDFDRSTRKGLGEWESIKEILVEADCKIVINSQEYDLEDENAELLTDIQAVIAKRERQMIRKRMIRGQEVKAKAGEDVGGPCPYGYRAHYPASTTAKRGSRIVELDPVTSEAIRLTFELYSTGIMGYALISDELTAKGYEWAPGIRLDWQNIYRIIRNPIYAGLLVRRRDYTKAQHRTKLPSVTSPSKIFPPIVSVELWQRCQAIRESKPRNTKKSFPSRWPLTGVLRCASCGGPMYISQAHDTLASGEKVYYHYYKCNQKIRRLGTCENQQNIRAELAHLAVLRGIKKIIAEIKFPVQETSPVESQSVINFQTQLLELDQEERDLMARLRLPVERGGIREDQFARYNQELLNRRDHIEQEIKKQKSKHLMPRWDAPEAMEIIDGLSDDDPLLGDIVRSLFKEIRLAKTGQKLWKKEWSARKKMDWVRLKTAILLDGTEITL